MQLLYFIICVNNGISYTGTESWKINLNYYCD